MHIHEGQLRAFRIASEHGFHENPRSVGDALMLIVTEAAEAMEDVRLGRMATVLRERDGKPEGLPSELADIVIRVMDLSEELGIDLEREVAAKMAYNESRSFRHGGKAL